MCLLNTLGIGKFTIVDDATVVEADLGVNFFVDEDALGMSRAQSCTERLLELNEEVQGDWFPKDNVRGLLVRWHGETRPWTFADSDPR